MRRCLLDLRGWICAGAFLFMACAAAADTLPTHARKALPAKARTLDRDAHAAFAAGDAAQALELIDRALKVGRAAALLLDRALIERKLDRLQAAADDCLQISAEFPDSDEATAAGRLMSRLEADIHREKTLQSLRGPAPSDDAPPAVAAPDADRNGARAEREQPPVASGTDSAAERPAAPAMSVAPAPVISQELPARSASSKHIVFWSGLAVGAAAAGTGLYFGMQSVSERNQVGSGSLTRSEVDGQISSFQRDATLGNVLVISGVVLIAGAAIAWFAGAP